ncbi:MAG: hypothetical protein Q4E35_02565 [Eubacteriales bacterium]|nr:hypothetical protein [Eubacteriales bacterium]
MKNFKFSVCAAGTVCASLCFAPSAFAQTFVDTAPVKENGLSIAIIMLAVLVVCFTAMAFIVRQGKTGHANVPWAILAILLAGIALIIAALGYNVGTVYTKPVGDPKDTVVDFFNAVKTGSYTTAYDCLSDYAGLGLENAPEDEIGEAVYEALKESYDYTIMGSATVSKLTAFIPVRVKYLDIGELSRDIPELVNSNIEKIVEETPRNQIYDADDRYLPEVTDRAYSQAVEKLLDRPEIYYATEQINVELEYENGQWYIVSDPALLNAISGGTLQ